MDRLRAYMKRLVRPRLRWDLGEMHKKKLFKCHRSNDYGYRDWKKIKNREELQSIFSIARFSLMPQKIKNKLVCY